MSKRWSLILHEPFRLFFPLGILFGIAGTGHWLIYGTGLSDTYSGYYHASLQMWLYMGSFVAGFLMTAIPRFASAPHAKTSEIIALLFLMLFIFICLTAKAWIMAGVGYIAWLLILFMFILRRFILKGHSVNPPLEFVWIPVAFIHAICGTSVIVLSQSGILVPAFLPVGRSMAQQGFLLSLVMGVGGFLGPRLMGLYEMPSPDMFKKSERSRKHRLLMHLGTAALLFISFWLEGPNRAPIAYFLRAIVVTFNLYWVSKVLQRPKIQDLFRRFLSLSFWFVVAGVWMTALFPKHHVAMLHVLFLGGFSLLTFLISIMVVLSHSGNPQKLGQPLWIYWIIFAGLMSALVVRLSSQFLPEHYFTHLAVASTLWIIVGVAWLIFSAPYLLRVPVGSEGGTC